MRVSSAEIAFQLFRLTICQRVHRVDDDRAGSRVLSRFPRLDRGIDDRDEETQRLPRARSSRDDVTLIVQGIADGLLLVLAKLEGSIPGAIGGGEGTKHVGTFRFQIAGIDKILDRSARVVVRVELEQRIGPKALGGIQFIDLGIQLRRADSGKRAGECLVAIDNGLIEVEYVHTSSYIAGVPVGRPIAPDRRSGVEKRHSMGRSHKEVAGIAHSLKGVPYLRRRLLAHQVIGAYLCKD